MPDVTENIKPLNLALPIFSLEICIFIVMPPDHGFNYIKSVSVQFVLSLFFLPVLLPLCFEKTTNTSIYECVHMS